MGLELSSRLLREARQGSHDAINAICELYGGRLHSLIRLRLGPRLRRRLESRDILQATFLKAFQSIEQFEGSGARSLMAWLGAIARGEIRDQAGFYRRQRRDAARETTFDGKAAGFAEPLRSEISRIRMQEESKRLETALEALRESHREVILLRYFEELSFREIGERLGKSPDASRMRLARALAALTVKLGEPHRPPD